MSQRSASGGPGSMCDKNEPSATNTNAATAPLGDINTELHQMRHLDWIFPLRTVSGAALTVILVGACSGGSNGSDSSSDTGSGGYFGAGGSVMATGGVVSNGGA